MIYGITLKVVVRNSSSSNRPPNKSLQLTALDAPTIIAVGYPSPRVRRGASPATAPQLNSMPLVASGYCLRITGRYTRYFGTKAIPRVIQAPLPPRAAPRRCAPTLRRDSGRGTSTGHASGARGLGGRAYRLPPSRRPA
jgi:hypothetical protein